MQTVDRTTALDDVEEWVDSAWADRTWLILMFHQIDDVVTPGVPPLSTHWLFCLTSFARVLSESCEMLPAFLTFGTTRGMLDDIIAYVKSVGIRTVTVTEGVGVE